MLLFSDAFLDAMWLQKVIEFSSDFVMNFNSFGMDYGPQNGIKKAGQDSIHYILVPTDLEMDPANPLQVAPNTSCLCCILVPADLKWHQPQIFNFGVCKFWLSCSQGDV